VSSRDSSELACDRSHPAASQREAHDTTDLPDNLIESALGVTGGHHAELKMHSPFACDQVAEAFAADALPTMRGLQLLNVHLGGVRWTPRAL
jgi:hypothetical protein